MHEWKILEGKRRTSKRNIRRGKYEEIPFLFFSFLCVFVCMTWPVDNNDDNLMTQKRLYIYFYFMYNFY